MNRRGVGVALVLVLACLVSNPAANAQTSGETMQFKKDVGNKAQGFMEFMTTIQQMAGVVKDMAQGAVKGLEGGPAAALAGAGALVVQGILAAVANAVKEPHVKQLISAIGERVGAAARAIGENGFSAAGLIGHLVRIAEPLALFAVERLPFPDESLRRLAIDGVSGLVRALRDPAAFKATYLAHDQPWTMVKAALGIVRNFVREKLGGLVGEAHLGPERDLLVGTVDAIFDLVIDDQRRAAFLSGKDAARPLLELLAGIAKPYLSARLRGLVVGTGLESVVDLCVNALFGPNGPVLKGAAFFTSLAQTLSSQGGAILGEILGALSGFLEMQILSAGRGPVVTGLLKGLLAVTRRALAGAGGLASLAKKGTAAVIALVGDVVGPLIDALAPDGQRNPALGFVRTVASGLTKLLGDVSSLAKNPATALATIGAAIAKAAKAAVDPLLATLPLDAAMKALLSRGVAKLFELLGGKGQVPGAAGVLSAIREGANMLLPILVKHLQKGLPPALRELPTALAAELGKLIANPQHLRGLHSGKLTDLVVRAFGVLGKPVARLIEAALPAAVRQIAAPLLRDAAAALGSPARFKQLLTQPVSAWLAPLKTTGLALLRKLISLVPGALTAAVEAAIGRVSAALASAASLTSALATTARTALDQTLSALVLRVPEGAARELALGLTSLLRDLVGAGAASSALRSSPGAVLARLLSGGARALASAVTDVVPEGAMRTLLRFAVDGLLAITMAPKALAEAQTKTAGSVLSRVAASLAATVRVAVRAAIADPAAATLVDSLFEVGVSMLLLPAEFSALTKKGLDGLLSRVVPIFRDYLVTTIGRGLGDNSVRGFVESILRAAVEMFSVAKAGAVAKPAGVMRLVGFGIATVKGLLSQLIEAAGLSPAVSAAVSGLFTWIGDLVSQPALLATTLRKQAGELLASALRGGKALLIGLVADAVRDAPLRELVTTTLSSVGDAIAGALSGPSGGGLGQSVKDILLGAVAPLAKYFRGKLLGLFDGQKAGVAALFVGEAYDGLVGFASGMLKEPGAWQKHFGAAASAGKTLLGKLAKWAFDLLARSVTPSIRVPALRGLVERLLSAVGEELGNFDRLAQAVRSPGGAARLLLPKLIGVVKPLLEQEVVARLPEGLVRNVVGAALTEGLKLLGDVDALARVPSMRLPDVMLKLVAFLKAHVVPPLVATLKLGDLVKGLINTGLDRLAAAAK